MLAGCHWLYSLLSITRLPQPQRDNKYYVVAVKNKCRRGLESLTHCQINCMWCAIPNYKDTQGHPSRMKRQIRWQCTTSSSDSPDRRPSNLPVCDYSMYSFNSQQQPSTWLRDLGNQNCTVGGWMRSTLLWLGALLCEDWFISCRNQGPKKWLLFEIVKRERAVKELRISGKVCLLFPWSTCINNYYSEWLL